jgi:hypothetical protein
LETETPLLGLEPFAQRVVDVPDDPDASTWHIGWYRIAESELRRRLPELARAMKPHWYGHFWENDDLCVILAGRAFWAKISARETWQDFICYGDQVGVERKWTENVPTRLPDWVEAASG